MLGKKLPSMLMIARSFLARSRRSAGMSVWPIRTSTSARCSSTIAAGMRELSCTTRRPSPPRRSFARSSKHIDTVRGSGSTKIKGLSAFIEPPRERIAARRNRTHAPGRRDTTAILAYLSAKVEIEGKGREMALKPHLIGGAWVEGSDGGDNVNPSDLSDVIGVYGRADRALAGQAIAAAKAAFPAWSRSTPQQRFDILDAAGTEILARKAEIGELLAREEGKIRAESVMEAARAGQIFKFFAGEALRIPGEHVASVRPGIEVDITREPLGVVGLITPWNFPVAIPAWKIAPALAYGNCVVLKPANLVPGCAWALADILHRAGVPEGVLNLVMGPGSTVGEALLESPDIAAISFTGSIDTGKRVAAACAARLARVQLEMGGKNPLVVLDDADLATAVSCAVNGAFFSTGQRCTASSRLIVTEQIHDP